MEEITKRANPQGSSYPQWARTEQITRRTYFGQKTHLPARAALTIFALAMLTTPLTHPGILAALAGAGHGAKILIADGHYPVSTTRGANADLVYLNLARGIVTCTQVLECLTPTIPIEAAAVMQAPASGPFALENDPPIWTEFSAQLENTACRGELIKIERMAFYEAIAKPDIAIVIATGDDRVYGNLLLTIGVAGA